MVHLLLHKLLDYFTLLICRRACSNADWVAREGRNPALIRAAQGREA